MFKLYYIFVWFFASFYFLSAQTVYYSSSPVPPGGIKTPKGSPVTSGGLNETRTLQARRANDAEKIQPYPNAQLVYDVSPDNASSLKTYNCHGYAWIYTDYSVPGLQRELSTGSQQCADVYTTDGSYIEVTHRIPGAKVFHHNHSAVITSDTNYYISKWEESGPLVRHLWNDSPYNSSMSAAQYFMQPALIPVEGPSSFCGTATFKVPIVAAGHTLSWSVSSGFTINGATNQPSVSVSVSTPSKSGTLSVAINGVTRTLSISSNCQINPGISGPSLLCSGSSGTFTVSNAPPGYTWTCSSSLTSGSSSGNNKTFTASSSGDAPGWVAVNQGSVELARKEVWIGKPYDTQSTHTISVSLDSPTPITPSLTAHRQKMGITNYYWVWHMNDGGATLSNPYGTQATVTITQSSGKYRLKAYGINSCGGYTSGIPLFMYEFSVGEALYRMTAYPNPVSSVLNVQLEEQELETASSSSGRQTVTGSAPVYTIRLYNAAGTLVLQTTANDVGTVQLNVGSLPNGIYTLHVHDGTDSPPLT
ncbi:MAG: T9SS type A sorting domain-containing protein, partial [Tannerella sp.]|nr:T9SS type A sorting domain-containing protein [Tannerella sp.]